MNNQIDTQIINALNENISNLSVAVARLETVVGQFGPALQGQATQLTDVVNRLTRLEERYQSREQTSEKRTESVRWFAGAILGCITLSITLLMFLIQHVRLK